MPCHLDIRPLMPHPGLLCPLVWGAITRTSDGYYGTIITEERISRVEDCFPKQRGNVAVSYLIL